MYISPNRGTSFSYLNRQRRPFICSISSLFPQSSRGVLEDMYMTATPKEITNLMMHFLLAPLCNISNQYIDSQRPTELAVKGRHMGSMCDLTGPSLFTDVQFYWDRTMQ